MVSSLFQCSHIIRQGLLLVGGLSVVESPGLLAYTPVSVYDLAVRYEHGEGLAKDLDKARELYCFGALFGELDSVYGLAWMNANGRGQPRNDAVAAGWLERGAAAGDKAAGRLLRRLGDVTPQADASCPPPGSEPTRAVISRWVELIAPRYALEADWVLAVIEAESGFRVRARSPKGALGLMQLIPATAQRFDVDAPLEPLQNLLGGMRYLRWLLDYFDGDPTLALAGYNAGENAVRRYQGVPPYRETQGYIRKIFKSLSDCDDAGAAKLSR